MRAYLTVHPQKYNRALVPEASRLTYKQLLRVMSILNAQSSAERAQAIRFVGSLTPPERKVILKTNGYKRQSDAMYIRAVNEVRQIMRHRSIEGMDLNNAKELLQRLYS